MRSEIPVLDRKQDRTNDWAQAEDPPRD
eukprot:gene26460-biopygen16540